VGNQVLFLEIGILSPEFEQVFFIGVNLPQPYRDKSGQTPASN
jgi:hypothetical protein